MSTPSEFRPSRQPGGGLTSVQDFDDLVQLLRASATGPEIVEVANTMGNVAQLVELISPKLVGATLSPEVGNLLVELLKSLRNHRTCVANLPPAWRALPEHGQYLTSLGHFRVLLNQWLMERAVEKSGARVLDQFEQLAWRTLGDGMLFMDVCQQVRSDVSAEEQAVEAPQTESSQLARAQSWWVKLRS